MRMFAFAILATSFLFVSCKKEEESSATKPPEQVDPTAYYPLTEGSYWIYGTWRIDTNGAETLHHPEDSVYITGDTLINGQAYALIKSTYSLFNAMVKDSSGYLVDHKGSILFAPNDFADSLETAELVLQGNLIYTGKSQMEKVPNAVTVPAGTFETLLNRWVYHIPGTPVEHREMLEHRAAGVGTVRKQFAYTSTTFTMESRLLRYHIAK